MKLRGARRKRLAAERHETNRVYMPMARITSLGSGVYSVGALSKPEPGAVAFFARNLTDGFGRPIKERKSHGYQEGHQAAAEARAAAARAGSAREGERVRARGEDDGQGRAPTARIDPLGGGGGKLYIGGVDVSTSVGGLSFDDHEASTDGSAGMADHALGRDAVGRQESPWSASLKFVAPVGDVMALLRGTRP